MSQKVKFFVRCFPQRKEDEYLEILNDRKTLWFKNPSKLFPDRKKPLRFVTDGIFTDDCQQSIFDETIGNSLHIYMNGEHDLVLMSFGEKGAGKTHTMFGATDNSHFQGLIPRMTQAIFKMKNIQDLSTQMMVLEFSPNKIRNLLNNKDVINLKSVVATNVNSLQDVESLLRTAVASKTAGRNSSLVVSLYITVITRRHAPVQAIHLVDSAGDMAGPGMWTYFLEHSILGHFNQSIVSRNVPMIGYMYHALHRGHLRVIGHVHRSSNDRSRSTLETLKFGCSLIGQTGQMASSVPNTQDPDVSNSQVEIQQLADDIELSNILVDHIVPMTSSHCSDEFLNAYVEKYLTTYEENDTEMLLTIANPMKILRAMKHFYDKFMQDYTSVATEVIYHEEKESLIDFSTHSIKSIDFKKKQRFSVKLGIGELSTVDGFSGKEDDLSREASWRTDASKLTDPVEFTPEELEAIKEGNANWNMLWKEFFRRNPFLFRKLVTLGADLKEAKKDRSAIEEQFKRIQLSLKAAQVEVDKFNWEREQVMGSKITGKERLGNSKREQVLLHQYEHLLQLEGNTLSAFYGEHERFIRISADFNKHYEAAEKLFVDYVNSTYLNILVVPPSDEYDPNIVTPEVTVADEIQKSETEEIFKQLQHKYFNK